MPKYKHVDLEQTKLFILSLNQFYPENHPLNRFNQLLEKLNWSKFDQSYINDTSNGGSSAYPLIVSLPF